MIIRTAPCTLILPVLSWVAGLFAEQYLEIPVWGLISQIQFQTTASADLPAGNFSIANSPDKAS
jgi:hypothetical protein